MTDTQKRLETALLDYIEQEIEEQRTEQISIVPAVAHELIELWKITN